MSGHFVRNGQRGSWISEGVAAFTNISLFSGAGGLDLGLRIAIRNLVTVCFVEREAYAAACLVARMEDKALDEAPVWDDITTFDGQRWRGCVDMLSGGFPCQDLSVAGKRAGIDGERSGLWSEFARLVGEIRPRFVFIENVSGLLNNESMRRVLGDLAAFGFNAEWECVRASAVGAPHRRERVFILAMDDSGRERRQQESRSTHGDEEPHGPQNDHKSPGSDEGLADTASGGLGVGGHSHRDSGQSDGPQPLAAGRLEETRSPPGDIPIRSRCRPTNGRHRPTATRSRLAVGTVPGAMRGWA